MPDPSTLPPGQRRVYDYLRVATAARGFPPTVREIGTAIGITSPNGVTGHLKALEQKGFIARDAASARSITFPDGPASAELHAGRVVLTGARELATADEVAALALRLQELAREMRAAGQTMGIPTVEPAVVA